MTVVIGVTPETYPPAAVAGPEAAAFSLRLPDEKIVYLWGRYLQAVLAGKALPVMLPVTDDPGQVRAMSERCDGFLLSGSPFDVPPEFYGERAKKGLGILNPARSRFERALVRAALRRDKPILGICGGLQLINVALGGTLYQDLLLHRPGSLDHRQTAPRNQTSHAVTVAPGSRLSRILAGRQTKAPLRLRVNSTHHQAVKDLGRGLIASALADDGVIEALEGPSRRFLLAVQWHPETLYDRRPEAKKIFRAFLRACSRG